MMLSGPLESARDEHTSINISFDMATPSSSDHVPLHHHPTITSHHQTTTVCSNSNCTTPSHHHNVIENNFETFTSPKLFNNLSIFNAIQSNNLQLTNFFITQLHCDVNGEFDGQRGASPLHWACYDGYNDVVQLLLSHGAHLHSVLKDDDEGVTPLMWAVQGGYLETVKLLVSHYQHSVFGVGTESECVKRLFREHLQVNSGYNILVLAIQDKHTSIVQYLMHHLFRHEASTEKCLNLTAQHVRSVLKQNFLDREQHSVLHWACYQGHLPLVKFIIQFFKFHRDRKGDVQDYYKAIYEMLTFKDSTNRSVLHWIARKASVNIMRCVLSELISLEIAMDDNGHNVLGLLQAKDSTVMSVMDYAQDLNRVEGNVYMQHMLNQFIQVYKNGAIRNSNMSILQDALKECHTNDQREIPTFHVNERLLSDEMNQILEHQSVTIRQMLMYNKQELLRFIAPIVIYLFLFILLTYTPVYVFLLSLIPVGVAYRKTKKFLVLGGDRKIPLRDLVLLGVFPASLMFAMLVFLSNISAVRHLFADIEVIIMLLTFFTFTPVSLYYWRELTFRSNPGYLLEHLKSRNTQESNTISTVDPVFFSSDGCQVLNSVIGRNYYCPEMLIRKTLRSRYDHFTEQIIDRFDHFCNYTLNPVGEMNHIQFLAFVLSVFLATLSFVCICIVSLYYKSQVVHPILFHVCNFHRYLVDATNHCNHV